MTGAIKTYLEQINKQFGLEYISYVVSDNATYANLKKYYKIEFLEDTVISELEITDMVTEDGSALDIYYNGKTVLAGIVVYGNVSKVVLVSGAIRLFRSTNDRDTSINPYAFLIDSNGDAVCDSNGDEIQVKG